MSQVWFHNARLKDKKKEYREDQKRRAMSQSASLPGADYSMTGVFLKKTPKTKNYGYRERYSYIHNTVKNQCQYNRISKLDDRVLYIELVIENTISYVTVYYICVQK